MAQIAVYNLTGEKKDTLALADMFDVTPNIDLVHQVYVALTANAREPWAHVKDRSEVRGGGKKPWRQKGTGRARHGSIRSPIWSGGGVTFGPRNNRNYTKKVNKRMKQQAIVMVLADKVREDKMLALESFDVSGKTKQLASAMSGLPLNGKTTLIVADTNNAALLLAARNLPRVDVVTASDVNVVDLLHHQYIVTSDAALKKLQERLTA